SARSAGRPFTAPASTARICVFQSSAVAGILFQSGLSGAPISFCTCGLVVPGTGSVLAGTSSDWANAFVAMNKAIAVKKERVIRSSLFAGPLWRALLDERADAFLEVRAAVRERHQVVAVGQHVGGAQAAQHFLGDE